jgi:hypothetical protein
MRCLIIFVGICGAGWLAACDGAAPLGIDFGQSDDQSVRQNGDLVSLSIHDSGKPGDGNPVDIRNGEGGIQGDGPAVDSFDPSCAGVVCNTPDKSTCIGKTLRKFQSPGQCAAGKCTYPHTDSTCSVACVSGACSSCAAGFKQWPCYAPATVPFTCCSNGRQTCSNGKGCTCYDSC